MKERIFGIDIARFFAVLLIINSHLDSLYSSYSFLATGGAIGDALFFFISAFTLQLGSKDNLRFGNWYKKRIQRICPTLFVFIVIVDWSFGSGDLNSDGRITSYLINCGAKYWFIPCILAYYILYYPILKFRLERYIPWIQVASIGLVCVLFFMERPEYIYKSYWMRLVYFPVFLSGCYVSCFRNRICYAPRKDIVLFVVSLIAYYCFAVIGRKNYSVGWMQLLSIPFIHTVIYYFFKICNSSLAVRLQQVPVIANAICSIGSLCLEAYITQFAVIRFMANRMCDVFPLNIFVTFVLTFICAYILRCVTRFVVQTFSKDDYDWKLMIRLGNNA